MKTEETNDKAVSVIYVVRQECFISGIPLNT
jgi:hypothetical protein